MDGFNPIASTPSPPYYSVIFTSRRSDGDDAAYAATANRMLELAALQDGYLGVESARDKNGVGITVSYWRNLDAIRRWHEVAEHREAQLNGRSRWYDLFAVRIALVERYYDFDRENGGPVA